MYMSYYGSFVLQCYVLRTRIMMSTVGGNLTNRPPALRHIHVKKKNYAITKKYLISKQQCHLHCPPSYKRIQMFICIVVFTSVLARNPVTCLKTLMNINIHIRQTYWSFVNTHLVRICNECYVLFLLLCIYSY